MINSAIPIGKKKESDVSTDGIRVSYHTAEVKTDEIQWHNVGQIPSQQENITDRRLEKSEQKG